MAANEYTSDRKAVIKRIEEAIGTQFGHWESSHVTRAELETLTEDFSIRAADEMSPREFILILLEYLNHLNNMHTMCFDMDVEPVDFVGVSSMGMSIEYIGGSWVVAQSTRAGLTPGDELISVGNESVAAFVDKCSNYFGELQDKTKTMRLNLFLPLVLPSCETQIGVRTISGAIRSVVIDRSTSRSTQPSTEGRRCGPGGSAYVRVPSFLRPEFEETAIDFVREYSKAESLVIDLRGNRGGNTPRRLISALMDRPWRWWRERRVGEDNYCDPLMTEPGVGAYRGRLAILVDRDTFSAAEDFTMTFKDNGRAVVIGEQTFGSSGQPYFMEIGSLTVGIGSMRVRMPNGHEFENVGIEPDIAIELKHRHLLQGDSYVEEALESLA